MCYIMLVSNHIIFNYISLTDPCGVQDRLRVQRCTVLHTNEQAQPSVLELDSTPTCHHQPEESPPTSMSVGHSLTDCKCPQKIP